MIQAWFIYHKTSRSVPYVRILSQQIDYYIVNHCSSEGATVGIKSYLSSRLKLQFKTKISKPKTISVQFQIKIHFHFISIFFSIQNQYPKLYFKILFNSFQKSNQNVRKYQAKLCMGSHHQEILNHDLKLNMGIKIKEWVVFNKLEDFNSLLKYTDDDFTPVYNIILMR